jgi:hypothetical protein
MLKNKQNCRIKVHVIFLIRKNQHLSRDYKLLRENCNELKAINKQ